MAAPTNYVLTVYKTEAAAKAGDVSTAYQVDSNGHLDGHTGQPAGYPFWTHTRYWYRIEANEPVKEFYIDWDDGEDNDPKGKANYTSIKLDTPAFVGITSHIYTGNSSYISGYFPKIRCKSVDGFWSKFYQNGTAFSGGIGSGIEVLQGETTLGAGRNKKYRIENESSTERIPALFPNIKPPIGVLKVDKKRVYAGIFNNYLYTSSGSISTSGETVTLIEVPNSGSAVRTGVEVRVTYTTTGEDGSTNAGRGDIKITDMNTDTAATIQNVSRIIKVELLNLLEDSVAYNSTGPSASKLYPGEKMALVKGTYSSSAEQTLAEVSLGNPIVELDDPRHTVTYDLTESFTRTSEQSISNYYLDDGARHRLNGFAANTRIQNSVNDAEVTSHSDVLSNNNNVQEVTSGVKRQSYAFDVGYNVVDSDFRWLPKQILARGQVKVTHPFEPQGLTARVLHQYSFLEHWVNEGHTKNYSDTVDETVDTYSQWTSDMTSSSVLAFKGLDNTALWKDLEPANKLAGGPTNYSFRGAPSSGQSVLFCNENCDSLSDTSNTAMLVCARDSKWTKQFWKTLFNNATVQRGRADYVIPGSDNDNEGVGTNGVGHMNIRVEAYYTAYENNSSAYLAWKPLKYLNKTKHNDYDDSTWYTDGTFDWEEPDDWVSCDPSAILNKYYPRGDYFTDDGGQDSWAFSTHNQAGASISDGSAETEVTVITVTSGDQKGRLAGGWIALNRAATSTWDIFWWKTVADDAPEIPSGVTVVDNTDGIFDEANIGSFNSVDISHLDEDTDIEFAEDLQLVIESHDHYGAAGTYTGGGSAATVTVTHAAAGSATDAPASASMYPNYGSAPAHTASVTTQGATAASGGDYFETSDLWDANNNKYGIMFLIKTDGGASGKANSYAYTDILNTWPCSNSHSALVDLIDPMCVSLNNFNLTQSIAFTHKGKYQKVEDRLGKSDIRKIGSTGGNLKFGGADLNDTGRFKFNEYQSKATPVYLDIEHRNGDISRFFGVITSMSEDHPTSKVIPKFGLEMTVSHMITMNSSGTMLSDGYISLGGEIGESKYV